MHTNWCVLIEISMEKREIKFWNVVNESCATVCETHFRVNLKKIGNLHRSQFFLVQNLCLLAKYYIPSYHGPNLQMETITLHSLHLIFLQTLDIAKTCLSSILQYMSRKCRNSLLNWTFGQEKKSIRFGSAS